MTTTNPDTIEHAIFDLLTGDATLMAILHGGVSRVWSPDGAQYPFARFVLRPSPPERWTMGGLRITPLRYQIDVVDRGESAETAYSALARIDELMSDGALTPSSGRVLYCRREGFIVPSDPERIDGTTYQMARASWLIEVQP